MAPFSFNELPTELRLQVWEEFLLQETEKRLVVVDTKRLTIFPMKRLISPLLTVNSESRTLTKTFYDYTIDIYTLVDPYSLPEDLNKPPSCTTRSLAGMLYLNLERDIFVKGFYFSYLPYQNQRTTHLSHNFKILAHYESEPMADEHTSRVQRSLYSARYRPLAYSPSYSGSYSYDYEPTCCSWCDDPRNYEDYLDERREKEEREDELFAAASEQFSLVFDDLDDEEIDLSIPMIIKLGGEGVFAHPTYQDKIEHRLLSEEEVNSELDKQKKSHILKLRE
ncbi:hypothetical protein M426DRAFT_139468 [Hypoxylon sp. CI-4A]|nr:hypothetical protein M426DRAFT_139468 [Hypoxylon sp. CI-4A]